MRCSGSRGGPPKIGVTFEVDCLEEVAHPERFERPTLRFVGGNLRITRQPFGLVATSRGRAQIIPKPFLRQICAINFRGQYRSRSSRLRSAAHYQGTGVRSDPSSPGWCCARRMFGRSWAEGSLRSMTRWQSAARCENQLNLRIDLRGLSLRLSRGLSAAGVFSARCPETDRFRSAWEIPSRHRRRMCLSSAGGEAFPRRLPQAELSDDQPWI